MERGMAAQELADRAGISRTRLHNIEKGAAEPKIGARLFAGRQSRGKVRLGTTI
jgi:transcriptional regulator with XRE-family HTH domain